VSDQVHDAVSKVREADGVVEDDVLAWTRNRCAEFEFDAAGVFRRHGDHEWPFGATDPEDLEAKLLAGGHLLPLPKEPAALANVLEVAIVDHLLDAASDDPEVEANRGSERGYPDVELFGSRFGGGFHALDVKVARRGDGPTRTQSRITLYTGNTYFKWPQLHWPGTFRPFADYASHLDLIVIYRFRPELPSRVGDLELIVQPAWRIASKKRSSTTREYIGAVDVVEDLREGRGEFTSPKDFYQFWRAFPFRISQQVQRQLDRLVRQQQERIAELEAQANRHDEGP
jgi:hypothetical protein